MVNERIHQLAIKSRQWAIETAIAENFPLNLRGLCARASAHLFKALVAEGYIPELCVTENFLAIHCYLVVNDHVIDITSSQFFNSPKLLIKEEHRCCYGRYDNPRRFRSLRDFVTFQKTREWIGREQVGESECL